METTTMDPGFMNNNKTLAIYRPHRSFIATSQNNHPAGRNIASNLHNSKNLLCFHAIRVAVLPKYATMIMHSNEYY